MGWRDRYVSSIYIDSGFCIYSSLIALVRVNAFTSKLSCTSTIIPDSLLDGLCIPRGEESMFRTRTNDG